MSSGDDLTSCGIIQNLQQLIGILMRLELTSPDPSGEEVRRSNWVVVWSPGWHQSFLIGNMSEFERQ